MFFFYFKGIFCSHQLWFKVNLLESCSLQLPHTHSPLSDTVYDRFWGQSPSSRGAVCHIQQLRMSWRPSQTSHFIARQSIHCAQHIKSMSITLSNTALGCCQHGVPLPLSLSLSLLGFHAPGYWLNAMPQHQIASREIHFISFHFQSKYRKIEASRSIKLRIANWELWNEKYSAIIRWNYDKRISKLSHWLNFLSPIFFGQLAQNIPSPPRHSPHQLLFLLFSLAGSIVLGFLHLSIARCTKPD